jgi:fatty-acid desaturase
VPLTILYVVYFGLALYSFVALSWLQLLYTYILFYFLLEFTMSLFIHRWATHNLWNPPVWFQNIMSVVSLTAMIGTPISYSAWHRNHHKHSDTDKDPHSPKYKTWYYIIFRTHEQPTKISLATDRLRNDWQLFLTKYETMLVYMLNAILFLVLPTAWFLTWATAVAMTTFWVMLVTGIMCHTDKVRDVPYMYLFAFSESFHKQHHIKPQLTHCWFDPYVWLVKKLGWA